MAEVNGVVSTCRAARENDNIKKRPANTVIVLRSGPLQAIAGGHSGGINIHAGVKIGRLGWWGMQASGLWPAFVAMLGGQYESGGRAATARGVAKRFTPAAAAVLGRLFVAPIDHGGAGIG